MSPEINRSYLEFEQNPKVLGVVTTTFYDSWYPGQLLDPSHTDKIRGDLALQFAEQVKNLNHNLVIVDGTPKDKPFYHAIREIYSNTVDQRERGMDAARQQGFLVASQLSETNLIAWAEPEKIPFVKEGSLWLAAKPVLDGTYDLVIPRRSKEGFASLPPYQAKSEIRANTRFHEILHKAGLYPEEALPLDVFFGPRIFNKKLLSFFTKKYTFLHPQEGSLKDFFAHVKPGNYNSATFFPVINILYETYKARLRGEEGPKVGSIEVPEYRHPKIQTDNEIDNPDMVNKRWDQYVNINVAAIHFVRYLFEQDTPTTRLRSRIKSL